MKMILWLKQEVSCTRLDMTPVGKKVTCQLRMLKHAMSNGSRKKPSYFPLYWLVDRDPYNLFITTPI